MHIKPFSFDELMARIRVLTRQKRGATSTVLTIADLAMDTAAHVVSRGGKVLDLSAKEYSVLEYMLYNKGVVLSP